MTDVAVVAGGMGGRNNGDSSSSSSSSSSSNGNSNKNDGNGESASSFAAPGSSSSPPSRLSDLVHTIVTRVAQQEDSPSKPSPHPAGAFDTANARDRQAAANQSTMTMMRTTMRTTSLNLPPNHTASAGGTGPLTAEEIKALLLLSATEDEADDEADERNEQKDAHHYPSSRASSSLPHSPKQTRPSRSSSSGFAAVERDELVGLVVHLQAHVNCARQRGMVVDEAHAVWQHGSQLGSPTQASMALAQVRMDGCVCVCVCVCAKGGSFLGDRGRDRQRPTAT
jgi:hypothetical protein